MIPSLLAAYRRIDYWKMRKRKRKKRMKKRWDRVELVDHFLK